MARSKICKTISALKHLKRLDISNNYLIGCLGEVLDALDSPLEYLSLRGCDLNEGDLISLTKSKHSVSLRELNLSKLCQFSIYESDRISPSLTLRIVKYFPNLSVLNISQNNLPDSGMLEFQHTLTAHMKSLKALDIAGNLMQFDSQVELVKTCAGIPTMQWIRLTCIDTSLNNRMLLDNDRFVEMSEVLHNVIKSCGREDIYIDVVRLSFAILVDAMDFFD